MGDWERRGIYLFVIICVSVPLMFRYSLPPARMKSAERLFQVIEGLDGGPEAIAFLALDFGPNTKAENEPQAEVVIEHLMRRRVPFTLFTQYPLGEGFLTLIPERVAQRLMLEQPGERWEYGRDWVNLGYRPGAALLIQGLAKSDNISEFFGKDALGNRLSELPATRSIRRLDQISLLAQFTGLVGTFDLYVQFFQNGRYRPLFGHGCTSITIPEAYIYLDSGQLSGLLEGLAGAAWYSELLRENYPGRELDQALVSNTALGVAHIVIIILIVVGNLVGLRDYLKGRRTV